MVLKLCPVIPANAGIHNHRYLLNGFDRADSSHRPLLACFQRCPPVDYLVGRQVSRSTESLCLFALLRPARLDGAAAFDRQRILGSTNGRFAPEAVVWTA
jgi:hypothetical protein